MFRQPVYVVCAEGEEALAEELAEPLRAAGYEVAHCGTVLVGESLIGTASKALATGEPIILCATTRSVGSAWAHKIVNAGHTDGISRVFVVHMEAQAYVEQLAVKAKVARYYDDPVKGVRELVEALSRNFPPVSGDQATPSAAVTNGQFLDQITELVVFDVEALKRFRANLREDVVRQFPAVLNPWQFLERSELLVGGRLTRTGVLLFGLSATRASVAAMVKCVRYYGTDRAAKREIETFDSTLTDQIVAAREFVARHVQQGEQPTEEQARAVAAHGYPMKAVREVIANALVHRDYSATEACVHVRVFEDRVEVSSPGTWLGHDITTGVTHQLTEFDGQSLKRNFWLAYVLSWVQLVEGDGSGVPTALRDCGDTGSPIPTVLRQDDFITVTLWPKPLEKLLMTMFTGMVPAALPYDTTNFVGRVDELRYLEAQMDAGLLVIAGQAGIGKTALAAHFARTVRHKFADGQLYLDLRGFPADGRPVEPAEALASLLSALGVPRQAMPSDVPTRAELYRSLLAERRMVVLLDNARSPEQVMPLLPGTSGCLAIVTSRADLSRLVIQHGAVGLSLNFLDRLAAGHLLAGSEQTMIDRIVEHCAGLPLALRIARAQVRSAGPDALRQLVTELREESIRLSATDSHPAERVLATSYRRLDAAEAKVFRLVSLHPGADIGLPAISTMTGFGHAEVHRIVRRLCSAYLLQHHSVGRYRLHDLWRRYAQKQVQQVDSPQQQHAAYLRMLRYYVRCGELSDQRWLADEVPVLLAVIEFAAQAGFNDETWKLARVVTPLLERQGKWDELSKVHENALDAAVLTNDPAKLADSYRDLGAVRAQFGHLNDARHHFHQSLELSRQQGDRYGEAQSELALARVRLRRGQHEQASSQVGMALAMFERIGDRHGQAAAMVLLADCEVQAGHVKSAFDSFTRARQIYQEVNDVLGESSALTGLGLSHHRLGNLSAAMRHFQVAFELSRESGSRYWAAVVLNRIGDTYASMGNATEARTAWEQASALFTEFGDPDAGSVRAKLASRDDPVGHRILTIDSSGFGRPGTVFIWQGLYESLRLAFHRAGIDWNAAVRKEQGDGVLILPPADTPDSVLLTALPQALAEAVDSHNERSNNKIQLRVAMHTGEVHVDEGGIANAATNFAFRLVDAAPLKDMLRQSDSPVALIVSDSFYEQVVRKHGDLRDYRSVAVAIKETRANAWLYTPPSAEA